MLTFTAVVGKTGDILAWSRQWPQIVLGVTVFFITMNLLQKIKKASLT